MSWELIEGGLKSLGEGGLKSWEGGLKSLGHPTYSTGPSTQMIQCRKLKRDQDANISKILGT